MYVFLFLALVPALVFICIIKCSILRHSSINISNILSVLVLYIISNVSEAFYLFYEKNFDENLQQLKLNWT